MQRRRTPVIPADNSPVAWWKSIDRLTESDKVRSAIDGGTLPALLEEWDRKAAAFRERGGRSCSTTDGAPVAFPRERGIACLGCDPRVARR